jgi:hypothetical protein
MPRTKHHGTPRYCRQCHEQPVHKAGLCADCYDSGDEPEPSGDGRLWACRGDREPDYGGVLGADGCVYSDADPGL